jgi:hypothetical protein
VATVFAENDAGVNTLYGGRSITRSKKAACHCAETARFSAAPWCGHSLTQDTIANLRKAREKAIMKVDTGASYLFSGSRNLARSRVEDQQFGAILSGQTADTRDEPVDSRGEDGTLDFTSMTRQELFDWMNGQLRVGEMSFDESSAFLGMTLKISAVTGEQVDLATDTSRIDFTEKTRKGIEFYQSHFDDASVDRLQDALDKMLAGR